MSSTDLKLLVAASNRILAGGASLFADPPSVPYEPARSTQDATLWLRRYHPERLEAWLERHDPQLRDWLSEQRGNVR